MCLPTKYSNNFSLTPSTGVFPNTFTSDIVWVVKLLSTLCIVHTTRQCALNIPRVRGINTWQLSTCNNNKINSYSSGKGGGGSGGGWCWRSFALTTGEWCFCVSHRISNNHLRHVQHYYFADSIRSLNSRITQTPKESNGPTSAAKAAATAEETNPSV